MHCLSPSRSRHGGRRSSRGFTLIETLVTVGIAGILSSIAYPSLEGHVLRARRSDGLVSLMQAQLAQERYRAHNRSYGELGAIGVRATSLAGHYAIEVASTAADGYELVATAVGRQARDASCQTLRLSVARANVVYASGPDAATANPDVVNRKCWNR
jgi:type IV pilus assembly protein PilE